MFGFCCSLHFKEINHSFMAFNRLQYASISTFSSIKTPVNHPFFAKKTSVSWLPSFAFKTLKWLDLVLKGAKASTLKACQHKCAWYKCCWKRCCFCLRQKEIYHVNIIYPFERWISKWWSHKSQWMGASHAFCPSYRICVYTRQSVVSYRVGWRFI